MENEKITAWEINKAKDDLRILQNRNLDEALRMSAVYSKSTHVVDGGYSYWITDEEMAMRLAEVEYPLIAVRGKRV